MVYILLITHLYFCVKTRLIQRHTFKGIAYSLRPSGAGTYAAFAQALGTTVGPGNIVGVAVAISTGGPGAVLWMWLCGILAMPTKYAESYLCLKYRDKSCGGPMVLLSQSGYKKTAVLWVVLCLAAGLFMGAALPSRSLADMLPLPTWLSGALLALFTLAAMSLGVSGISRICSLIVPVMSVGFILLCAVAICLNISELPSAVSLIVRDAFSLSSAVGGGMGAAIKSGVARGLYSNEAGLGSGGVLAAEANDGNTVMSALAAMTTCFWDTVVMCSLTGVVFVMGGAGLGCDPAAAVIGSFSAIPHSRLFIALSMSLFVYATVIGWYCIARRALSFLSDLPCIYDALFLAAVFFGAVSKGSALWSLADSVNFLLAVPSLFIFIKLSGKINLYISNK